MDDMEFFLKTSGKNHTAALCSLIALLCAVMAAPGLVPGQAGYTEMFRRLLCQIESVYLAPNGLSLDSLESGDPAAVAALMGHALRQQKKYVESDQKLGAKFAGLQSEVKAYLSQVAERAGGKDKNGGSIDAAYLWTIAGESLQGGNEQYFAQEFKAAAGQMLCVLGGAAGPSQADAPAFCDTSTDASLRMQKETSGQ